jgi:hypothetical protein
MSVDPFRNFIRRLLDQPPPAVLTGADFEQLVRHHGSQDAALRFLSDRAQQMGQPHVVNSQLPSGASQNLYFSPRGWLSETSTDAGGALTVKGPSPLDEWIRPQSTPSEQG